MVNLCNSTIYNSPSKVRQASLFWDLETMLSSKNSLCKLACLIDRDLFEQFFAPLYSKDNDRMAKLARLMVGLLVLKHKFFRKRAGTELVIGHCKTDHRLGRNFYKGLFGDSANVMFAVAEFNFKRAMRLLLCLVEGVMAWCCGRKDLNFQH